LSINFISVLYGWDLYYLLNMENKTVDRYYDVFRFGEKDPCELIDGEPNIEVNEYGYKLMGHLYIIIQIIFWYLMVKVVYGCRKNST